MDCLYTGFAGIASNELPHGDTANSFFALPVTVTSTCLKFALLLLLLILFLLFSSE